METVSIILGLFCLFYYVLIAFHAGCRADFAWFWILLGVFFLGAGRLLALDKMKEAGGILFCILFCAIALLMLVSVRVLAGMKDQPDRFLPYMIVLGAQVRGTMPSTALKKRLDRALEYARIHPGTVLILSGGRGKNEDISEARCMAEYLGARGIAPERMVLEERSVSTWENLRFSDALTGCASGECGIVSNNFHICRALLLARRAGYEAAYPLPAGSDPVMQLHYVTRECAALVVAKLRGAI